MPLKLLSAWSLSDPAAAGAQREQADPEAASMSQAGDSGTGVSTGTSHAAGFCLPHAHARICPLSLMSAATCST